MARARTNERATPPNPPPHLSTITRLTTSLRISPHHATLHKFASHRTAPHHATIPNTRRRNTQHGMAKRTSAYHTGHDTRHNTTSQTISHRNTLHLTRHRPSYKTQYTTPHLTKRDRHHTLHHVRHRETTHEGTVTYITPHATQHDAPPYTTHHPATSIPKRNHSAPKATR